MLFHYVKKIFANSGTKGNVLDQNDLRAVLSNSQIAALQFYSLAEF